MTFLIGALILVSIIAESSCSLKTKLPPCLFSEVGSTAWFNFSSDQKANFFKPSADCRSTGPRQLLLRTGACTIGKMDCTFSDLDQMNYRLPLFNVTPADAGIYTAFGDNGFSTSDNSSTAFIPYEYATLRGSLDGEFTLEVKYWGRLDSVTMHCSGASRQTVNTTFNKTEVRVFGLRGCVIYCTATAQVPSWCQSNSFTCTHSLMFNIPKNIGGDCPTPSRPIHDTTSTTGSITTLSDDVSMATTVPTESSNNLYFCFLLLLLIPLGIGIYRCYRKNRKKCMSENAPPHETATLRGNRSKYPYTCRHCCCVDAETTAKPGEPTESTREKDTCI